MRKHVVRIVEGLEFVSTENRKIDVRIVEGLEFVNTEKGKHIVRIVEGLLNKKVWAKFSKEIFMNDFFSVVLTNLLIT